MAEVEEATPGRAARGAALLTALYVALRTGRTFDPRSDTVKNSIGNLHEALRLVWDEQGEATLQATNNFLGLNDARLKVPLSGIGRYTHVLRKLKSCHIGSVSFEKDMDQEELTAFIVLLARFRRESDQPLRDLVVELRRHDIRHVYLEAQVVATHDDASVKERAVKGYFRSVGTVKQTMTRVNRGLPVNMRSVKRAVQEMTELTMQDDFFLRCLANSLRSYSEYTFIHSTNVSVLAIAFGLYLAAPKKMLGALGVAALLHDIGKLSVPRNLLHAERGLDNDEWDKIRGHPLNGVRTLLRTPQLSESTVHSMAVCFEHHRGVREGGYPTPHACGKPSLLGRIVGIVDCYDAMTTPRPYRRKWFTPAEAYDVLVKEAGTRLDAGLLRHFILFQGFFPTGWMVDLNTGERAIVCGQPDALEQMDKPKLKTVPREAGEEPTIIDLAATFSDPPRHITRLHPPNWQADKFEDYIRLL